MFKPSYDGANKKVLWQELWRHEFEAAVDLLITEDGLAERLGACGRQYVEANYQWDKLSDRYERLLRRSIEAFGDRSTRQVGR